MTRLSEFFLPTIKETPAEAEIVSHQLMLRAGMIRQSSAGIYSWLPMGYRVLKKIEQIVREEQNIIGAQEMLMPTIQSADLWRDSGRYDEYGPEMLRIKDRRNRDMLYGPTNEEQITEIFAASVNSYRDLPKMLYQIQWKFRDEMRPRFGVMRGREFLMKDAYSFDLDAKAAYRSYNKMFVSYLRTYERMGLTVIPVVADAGPMGGNMSHEFLILAETGESEIACHKDLLDKYSIDKDIDFNSDLQPIVDRFTNQYAATDEKRDYKKEKELGNNLVIARGIEVGHIFYFGTKYSEKLNANVTNHDGKTINVHMGSYGIGVSRLVAAIIEANHDDKGIIWPETVSPFRIGLINIKVGDTNTDNVCENLYGQLNKDETLYDDREKRAGQKFAEMDLIGLPWQLIVGPRGLKNNIVELKNRATGKHEEISIESALSIINNLT